MERKMYQPTEKQLAKWNAFRRPAMPSDEQFKLMWRKRHGGKEAGWGMMKRDFVLSEMKFSPEYQQGMWQGRLDAARGLPYSEERNDNTYNLGYYRGYTNPGTAGWDDATRQAFVAQVNG